MTKNWTHDLPVDKGAFEGGNLERKRADEHILLSVGSRKNWNFSRYSSVLPGRGGGISLFSPQGARGTSEVVNPYVTKYGPDLNKTYYIPV